MDMLAPILRVILVVIATLIDERKVERYRARNAAGQCALCGCVPPDGGVRRISHRNRAANDLALDVCERCIARRRRERIVVWTIVLGVAVAVLWWSRRYR